MVDLIGKAEETCQCV